MLVENIDTQHLISLNNSIIQILGMGKPHTRNENLTKLKEIKQELIKRGIVSEYVLDYTGRL